MKIFLTGGTGFIGSHFINQAHAAGHEIVALRRAGSQPRIALVQQPHWHEGLLDADCRVALKGCDVLVHLAAHTPNRPYDSLEKCLYWNVLATVRLFDQAMQLGIDKFLAAGSCFEYGRSASSYERIPTDAPLRPEGSYPTSKAAASIAFTGFAFEHAVQVKIYRVFQVFGEGEAPTRFLPLLRRAAIQGEDFSMTRGEQMRDFIDVRDVAATFVRGLDFYAASQATAQIAHVGTGRAQSLAAFAQHWWAHFGATGRLQLGVTPYRPDEMMRLVPEIDVAVMGESDLCVR